jgi:hypothetical protein
MSASRERNGGIAEFDQYTNRLFNHTSMVVLLIDMLAVELYVQLKRSMRPCYDRVVSEYGGKGRASDVGFT